MNIDGFEPRDVVVDGVHIHAEIGGSGPPLLLLHGYPQTHVMWHRVAPALARTHTVVAADLRGYGDSDKPAAGEEHAEYGKRAMAADQVGLMAQLGHERFAVAGHDRGARVVHRMCLDHPQRVERAAVLDIVPTRHIFANVDRAMATAYYHWFFLAQPPDLPERLIGGDPDYFLNRAFGSWAATPEAFAPAAIAEYLRCFRERDAIAASCEDYRAGASIDIEHDDVDAAAGRRVECPLLVVWGERGFVGGHYDVPTIWGDYAADVRPLALDCGHFVAEERADETAAALIDFFG